jgi:hypothetical protein
VGNTCASQSGTMHQLHAVPWCRITEQYGTVMLEETRAQCRQAPGLGQRRPQHHHTGRPARRLSAVIRHGTVRHGTVMEHWHIGAAQRNSGKWMQGNNNCTSACSPEPVCGVGCLLQHHLDPCVPAFCQQPSQPAAAVPARCLAAVVPCELVLPPPPRTRPRSRPARRAIHLHFRHR